MAAECAKRPIFPGLPCCARWRSRSLTTYLAGYRVPLYERLAERHGVEVLCFGGGERYVPGLVRDLDAQLGGAVLPGPPALGRAGGARGGRAPTRR